MILAFKEVPIGKFSLRFYKTDHVWTCTINEDVLNAIRELTMPQENLYNPYAPPHFVLNPPTELPTSFIAEEKTQEPDCYGDGNVYRGVRSKDSEIQTIHIDNTAKTLTDEEIHKIAQEHFHAGLGINPLDFAKAILNKASEK